MALNKREIKNILKLYEDLKFPASYQSIAKFRKALKQEKNIDISFSRLKDLLRGESPYYLTSFKTPTKFPTRPIVSSGSFIEAFADFGISKSNKASLYF